MNNSQRHYKLNFQMILMYILMGIFLRMKFSKRIKKLKNNKACGEDGFINEYIKSTSNRFIQNMKNFLI